MALVFEKPQPGVMIHLSGLTEEEAARRISEISESLPPDPSTINLGCGPEPDGIDIQAVQLVCAALHAAPDNLPLETPLLESAMRTGAWFYWIYATELAKNELTARYGKDKMINATQSRDNSEFGELRREKLRWIVSERFGIEMT